MSVIINGGFYIKKVDKSGTLLYNFIKWLIVGCS